MKSETKALEQRVGPALTKVLLEAYANCRMTPEVMAARKSADSDLRAYIKRLETELHVIHVIAQPDWAVHFPAASVAAVLALRDNMDQLDKASGASL